MIRFSAMVLLVVAFLASFVLSASGIELTCTDDAPVACQSVGQCGCQCHLTQARLPAARHPINELLPAGNVADATPLAESFLATDVFRPPIA